MEPFGEDVHLHGQGPRPMSYLSTATTQSFYTARGVLSPTPGSRPMSVTVESRPMSMTSFESAYSYANMDAVVGGEDVAGRKTNVTFENEEKTLHLSGTLRLGFINISD